MKVEVEIIDRIYHQIVDFCEFNHIEINDYMSDAITDRYNLDKYGDLNEKFAKKEEKKKTVSKTVKKESVDAVLSENNTEIKTDVAPISETVAEKKVEETVSNVVSETKVTEVCDSVPVKKVRRTLKTR